MSRFISAYQADVTPAYPNCFGGKMPNINWFELTIVRPIVGRPVLFKGPAADDESGNAIIYASGSYHPSETIPWLDTLNRAIVEFCPTHWTYLANLE